MSLPQQVRQVANKLEDSDEASTLAETVYALLDEAALPLYWTMTDDRIVVVRRKTGPTEPAIRTFLVADKAP